MDKLEKEVEKKLVAMVKRHGGRCLKWVCPGWSGVPDRILLLPGGHIYFIETKRPKGGVMSALQEKWREWLFALGFYYGVVWSEADVAALELVIASRQDGFSAKTVIFDEWPGGEPDEDI